MPEIPQAKLFELVGLMFDAAQKASPDTWDGVYSAIAAAFGSGPGGLVVYDRETDEFKIMAGTRDDRGSLQYLEQFQHVSPFRKNIVDLKPGERFNREVYMSDEDFRKTEIYRDSFAPAGVFHLEYRVFRAYRETCRGLLLSRPEGQNNFDSAEMRALTFLIDYLEKAFQVYVNLIEAKRESHLMSQAFDCVSYSVLVVDQNEKLVFANRSGKEIISNANGFHTDRFGKLHASTAEDSKHFREVLEKIFDSTTVPETAGAVMRVSRGSGHRPLEVLITPCDENNSGDSYSEPLAIIFVSDPEQQYETTNSVLTDIYGLTVAEARIAGFLANGMSLDNICEELDIRQNTVRTHLKHIFSKTETNRQADLIKLIVNGPANLKIRH